MSDGLAASANNNWGKGRGGRPWRRLRLLVLDRDKYLCKICENAGILTEATEVDHIIGVAEGCTDDMSNLRSVCKSCHDRITAIQRSNATSKKVRIGIDGWPIG